jgi:hypothetical protein
MIAGATSQRAPGCASPVTMRSPMMSVIARKRRIAPVSIHRYLFGYRAVPPKM